MKHSYYKGCIAINTKEYFIISNYFDGIHKEGNERILLEKGCTKYNKIFLEQVNELEKKYTNIISCECIIVALAQKYSNLNSCDSPIIEGMVRNIFGLMTAQKGTRNYLRKLKHSLLTYKVKHRDIYDVLKCDIDKMFERYERNRKLLDDFFIDYGFISLVTYFRTEKNCTIYEDIENYRSACFSDTNEFSDEFYKLFEKSYLDYLETLAEQNNFEIYTGVKTIAKTNYEHTEKVKENLKKEKKETALEKKYKKCSSMLDAYYYDLMTTIRRGENFGRVSISTSKLAELCLTVINLGGQGYILTKTHGSKPMFYTEDGKYSSALSKAYIVKDKTLLLDEKEKAFNNNMYADIFSLTISSNNLSETKEKKVPKKDKVTLLSKKYVETIEKEINELRENIQSALYDRHSNFFTHSNIVKLEETLLKQNSKSHIGNIIVVKELGKELQYYTGISYDLTTNIKRANIYSSQTNLYNVVKKLTEYKEKNIVRVIPLYSDSIYNDSIYNDEGKIIVVKERGKDLQYYTGHSYELTTNIEMANIYSKQTKLFNLIKKLTEYKEGNIVRVINISSCYRQRVHNEIVDYIETIQKEINIGIPRLLSFEGFNKIQNKLYYRNDNDYSNIIVVKKFYEDIKYYTGAFSDLTNHISNAAFYDISVDLTSIITKLQKEKGTIVEVISLQKKEITVEQKVENLQTLIQGALDNEDFTNFTFADLVSIENKLANVYSGNLIVVKEEQNELLQFYTANMPFLTTTLSNAAIYDINTDLSKLVEYLTNLSNVNFVKVIQITSRNKIRKHCSEYLQTVYKNFLKKYIPKKELDTNKNYCIILAYDTKTSDIYSCYIYKKGLHKKKIGNAVDSIKLINIDLNIMSDTITDMYYHTAEQFPYCVFQLFNLSKKQILNFNNRFNDTNFCDLVKKINNKQIYEPCLENEYNNFISTYRPATPYRKTKQILCLQYNKQTKEIGCCRYSTTLGKFTRVIVKESAEWYFDKNPYTLYNLNLDIIAAYSELVDENPNMIYRMFIINPKVIGSINKRKKTTMEKAYEILDIEYNNFLLNYIPKQTLVETTHSLYLQYNHDTNEVGICRYSTKTNRFSQVIVIGSADWFFANKIYDIYKLSDSMIDSFKLLEKEHKNITYKMFTITPAQIAKFNNKLKERN